MIMEEHHWRSDEAFQGTSIEFVEYADLTRTQSLHGRRSPGTQILRPQLDALLSEKETSAKFDAPAF